MSDIAGQAHTTQEIVDAIKAAVVTIKEGGIRPDEMHAATPLYMVDDSDQENVLAFDSLDLMDLVATLEEEFDLYIAEDAPVEAIHTIGDLAGVLVTKSSELSAR